MSPRTDVRLPVRVYRAALRLLPAALRTKHGEAMVALFARELERARAEGGVAVLRMVVVALADVARRASYERVVMPEPTVAPVGAALPPMTTVQLGRRLLVPFLSVFTVLTGTMIAPYVVRHATLPHVTVLALSLPFTAALTIPMSVFVAMLWVSRRVRIEWATPVIPRHVMRAVLLVSSVIAVSTGVLASEIVPRTNARIVNLQAGHTVARYDNDRSMTLGELRRAARVAASPAIEAGYSVEIHKKFVLAAACIVLAFAGLTIGWRAPRMGVRGMTVASLGVFGGYWLTLMAAESLADQLVLPPWLAMWSGTLIGLTLVAASLRPHVRWRMAR